MFDVYEKQWESITDYDYALAAIPHYSYHPEMMPFVGRHYPKTRILLVGESHYLDEKDRDRISDITKWYSTRTGDYEFCYPGFFNTRSVVHSFLICRRSKAHSIFRNPANALIHAWALNDVSDSEAFCAFAFMNYYQRPACVYGKSIVDEEADNKSAYENLKNVISALKPHITIFLSKKAYLAYSGQRDATKDPDAAYVNHPTCSGWHNENGEKKLIGLFHRDLPKFNAFSQRGHLSENEANAILHCQFQNKDEYRKIERHGRRFGGDGKTTIQYYSYGGANGENEVSEIVWRMTENETNLGIGYVVDRRFLWVWDYSKKKYLNYEDLDGYPKMKNLYSTIISE